MSGESSCAGDVLTLLLSTLRNNQCDIVMLFTRTEPPDIIQNGRKQCLWRQFMMLHQRLNQPLLSKFFTRFIEGFGYSVGVENECVSRQKRPFLCRAIPLLKYPQNCAGGIELFNRPVVPDEEGGHMPAIDVAQSPFFFVVFGKEERGIRHCTSVFP